MVSTNGLGRGQLVQGFASAILGLFVALQGAGHGIFAGALGHLVHTFFGEADQRLRELLADGGVGATTSIFRMPSVGSYRSSPGPGRCR